MTRLENCWRGRPTRVERPDGTAESYAYDAWGNVLDEEVAASAAELRAIRYRFQGREFSAATGLTNFRMRWYDSVTGRWLSKDPIGLNGGLNLYAFCDGNPMSGIDSYGLCSSEEASIGGSCAQRNGKFNNYRADPYGHGKKSDGSPKQPHIDQYPKRGGEHNRFNIEGNPLSGKGNVPQADKSAFERAVQDLMKFLPKTTPLMVVPTWVLMTPGEA